MIAKSRSKVSNCNNLTIEQFNKLYPIGTKVRYYPISSVTDKWEETKTDSKAYELCSMKMVSLERGRGGYCLDNIYVLDKESEV